VINLIRCGDGWSGGWQQGHEKILSLVPIMLSKMNLMAIPSIMQMETL